MTEYINIERKPEERAELLLRELTLDEKMAQVNCVFPFDKTYQDMDWISAQTPFGIGEVSTLEMRRLETLETAADWQRTVQRVVIENSPHHIPAIFHMEGLCGAFIQEAVSLPSGIARGAGFHPELEEEIGAVVAGQEAACGITHILAPVLDISRDSRMGRQGETYGEDPALAAAMGAAYVRGVQNTRMGGRAPESVAKHFLAFHNSQGGIHGTHSDTPERLLREVYGKPFQAAIQAGLRELFANGEADTRLLDRAVLRVLTAKFRMGLFEHPFAMEDEQLRKVFYDSRAAEVTRQSAQESLVLLKNNGVLPLNAGKIQIGRAHV